MYVCGPTPYDAPHLGHGRKEVVFDTIRRYLLWCGFDVTYVSNVTDVEDKIIARARGATASPSPSWRPSTRSSSAKQFDRLNILRPDEMPRATEWIDADAAMIAELVGCGHAYVIEGEGVYFQVDSLPEYGALSHRTLDDLLESAGARVEVDERKRSPVDFALWKAAKPGEPSWESPWGPGRPGWHIECTAMSLEASSATASTSTAAAATSCSRTTRTSSRRRSAPATSSRALLGPQRDAQRRTARRCRSRSATSRPSPTCSTATTRARSACSC